MALDSIGRIGFLQTNPIANLAQGFNTGFESVQNVMDTSRSNQARELFGQSVQAGQLNPLLAAASPELAQQFQNQQRLEGADLRQQEQLGINQAQEARAAETFDIKKQGIADAEISAENQLKVERVARDAKTALDIQDPAQRQQFLEDRARRIFAENGDPSDTIAIMNMPFDQQNIALKEAFEEALPFTSLGKQNKADTPAAVKETEWFLKQPEDVRKAHLEVKRKTNPSLAEKLEQAQSMSDIKVKEEGEKVAVKGAAERAQGFIDSGIEAADSLGNIVRMSELLDSVETGGFDAAALRAKQIFGLESADEAELSAGLGKSILAQLKPIFGAAFTAQEGERLERIEAGFGKSTAGNKRLLGEVRKITERAARRGLKAAKAQGDEFTVTEIEGILEGLKGDSKPAKKPAGQAEAPTTIGRFQVKVN
jgi:hypothetical protein